MITMNKPTSTFKLAKTTKTMMSRIADDHARGHFKRMMIDAQLEAQKRPSKSKED
jgi:hypothetical protein